VRIDGQLVGRSPIAAALVACGEVTVTLERSRYQRVERVLPVSSTGENLLDVQLVRPPAILDLRSSPPGATFTVNGEVVGRAPAKAEVTAYTYVRVEASMEGQGAWSQKVYVGSPRQTVTASLPPPGGRKGPPPRPRPQL